MALTTDPVFVVPAYGWERAAWFAVHILASDASTSGLPLRWMTVDLNLPPELSDEDLGTLWSAYSKACEELGVAIVTGHTGRYDGCAWPMVGGVGDQVGMDPYISISEGTLIATVRGEHAGGYLAALEKEGIEAADVGEVTEADKGTVLVVDGEEQALEHPGLDPFWGAFGRW